VNKSFLTGSGPDEGRIDLTLLSPSEHRRCTDAGEYPVTTLLTARGKDHDMSADQLRALGNACLLFAEKMGRDYGND
jgi:hypothetical protein